MNPATVVHRDAVRAAQEHALRTPLVRANGPDLPLMTWEAGRWQGGLALTVNK